MNSTTCAVSIDVPAPAVYDFVSKMENLPAWAVEFCKGLRRNGKTWLVSTMQGEVACRINAHPEAGSVDFVLQPAPGVESTAFARVIPRGPGSEFVFTFFQAPGMPDAVFAGQQAALRKELAVLKSRLENGR